MKHKVPTMLNKPIMVSGIEIDVVAVVITLCFIPMILHNNWLFFGVPPLTIYYTKAKIKYNRGFIIHLLYFIGFVKLKGCPSYFVNTFRQ